MLLNSLGRVLVASGLVAVTSFMASTAAFAEKFTASTGQFTIGGDVAPTISIGVSNFVDLGPTLTAGSLPATRVADVTYKTNGNGLKITVAGELKLADANDSANTIPFAIGIVGGTGYQATTGNVLLDTGSVPVASNTAGLWIQSPAITHVIPGVYRAYLTLNAADN